MYVCVSAYLCVPECLCVCVTVYAESVALMSVSTLPPGTLFLCPHHLHGAGRVSGGSGWRCTAVSMAVAEAGAKEAQLRDCKIGAGRVVGT